VRAINNNNSRKIRSFLRWAGSKKQILPTLASYWDKYDFKRYIEPFAGSACLFFYLNPPKAILNDINADLIDTFNQVRNHHCEIGELLKLFPVTKQDYYSIRKQFHHCNNPIEKAAIFIYLNRNCFNGLYRTNNKGEFNVPYGGERSGNLPNAKSLKQYSEVLKNAELSSCDFSRIFEKLKKGDFIYLDPPYYVEGRRVFREYNKSNFKLNDIERLRECLDLATEKDIAFLVSYAKCPEVEILKQGYQFEHTLVRRNIAGFSKNRRTDEECLISNIDQLNL